MIKITVDTPQGIKTHGFIEKDRFIRHLTEKDRMNIFDAYSLNPNVYKKLEELNIKYLDYVINGKNYRIELKNLEQMLSGKITNNGKKLAWQAEFAGGKTIYITMSAWTGEYNKQLTLV